MTTLNDRLTAATEELKRSLDSVPEPEFRPAATRLMNLAAAAVAAAIVFALVAIPVWLTRDGGTDVVDEPATTPSLSEETAGAAEVARLDGLALIGPIVLDDGTLIARAQLSAEPEGPPQVGFGRSTNGGTTWVFTPSEETLSSTGVNLAAVGSTVVAPARDETGSVWVLTSEDSGATWSTPEIPVPDGYFPGGMMGAAVTVDEAGQFVVYGGNGKWVSSDAENWHAGLLDTSNRSLMWLPQVVDGVLVVPGVDNRIYAAGAEEALEVVLEPAVEAIRLVASGGTALAWGMSTADSSAPGSWLGTTSDGRTWSEHVSDLQFTVVHPLSDDLGSGYVAVAPGPTPGTATVYRSPDLDTWTEITTIETGAEITISVTWAVEVDGGVLMSVWDGQQSLWLVELGE